MKGRRIAACFLAAVVALMTFSTRVTALSAEADTVSILRPGSGVEPCSIEEFLAATRFESYDDMPFTVKLGLTFGSWSRNTAIFAE